MGVTTDSPGRRKKRRRLLSVGLGTAVGALVLGALRWYTAGGSGSSQGRPAVSAYEGTRLDGAAPGFRLVDQSGSVVSLSDFHGKVVVLTLLDPDCTDVCPLYAYQFKLAYQSLGADAANVVFLAINANNKKTAVKDVSAATRKWGVAKIPSWHFLTGSPAELESVWAAYSVLGSGPPKPDKPGEMTHSPAIFVIDWAGQRRWFFSTVFDGAPSASALIVKHVKAILSERRQG